MDVGDQNDQNRHQNLKIVTNTFRLQHRCNRGRTNVLKFFRFLVNSIAVSSQSIDSIAEWQQPTYWQALTAAGQSRSNWGHPIGIRVAATWSLCPALAIPAGVKDVTCSGATCMQICEDGKAAMGRRRVKCRWKRKKGFFWKKVSYGHLKSFKITSSQL